MKLTSIINQFSLHPDPSMWGYDVSPQSIDDDDWLHKPDKIDDTGSIFTRRGLTTVGFMFLLALGLVGLLYVTLARQTYTLLAHTPTL